ncbi:21884_t:CDS:2 [Entrophospora sp. SA101]|nr:21884_t:CDS:2 [Entrophospora sp. SA101]
MSDLNPGKHPFIPRRGYKLDSTRERELESELKFPSDKTIAGGYEPQENGSKVSNIPVDNKSSLDTKYPAPEKSLRKYLHENIKMQLRKPEVSATSPEIKIVDTNSPDKDKSGTSSFKDDTLQNIEPIKIDVPITRKKKSTPVSIESFKELNLKFDAVIAEFEKEKKTLIDINAKLHARIVELEHDKKATDARIRNLVEENGDLYFDVSLQNKENDTRFAKLEQTQDRIISFFSNNQSTPVSIESNLKPLTAELKKQLTPVSIESFKKKLDSILDAVIAEFEKGDGIYCFNNIMEPIVDINRALTDVNIALIDVNAKPYAGFKALENDDREYDERLLEYKERLQEYDERFRELKLKSLMLKNEIRE